MVAGTFKTSADHAPDRVRVEVTLRPSSATDAPERGMVSGTFKTSAKDAPEKISTACSLGPPL